MEFFQYGAPAALTHGHPLRARALCDSLVEALRTRILDGEFRQGQQIDERLLVEEYGISRTPVREALKRLQYEGLLTSRPHYGMYVAVVSSAQRREAERLYRLLHSHARQAPAMPEEESLLQRMLELAEIRLRLAYGPAFRERMLTAAAPLPPAA
ncbi:MAG: winged helix-turn-helix domain-containing protein [Brachymonas denitrificans]